LLSAYVTKKANNDVHVVVEEETGNTNVVALAQPARP
jgi:hypothetical protein